MQDNWDQIVSLFKAISKIYPKIKNGEASPSEQADYYSILDLLNNQSESFFNQLGSLHDSHAQKWCNKCYTVLTNLANKELKQTKALLRPTTKTLYEFSTFKVLHQLGNVQYWKERQKQIYKFLQSLPKK